MSSVGILVMVDEEKMDGIYRGNCFGFKNLESGKKLMNKL